MTTLTDFQSTSSAIYPRIEGNNICTWIGFKHVMYVVEEAVVDYFRQNGFHQRRMYEENGLCLELIESDIRILHALHIDDQVSADVSQDAEADADGELRLHVTLNVTRGDATLKAVVCRVGVQFKEDDSPVTAEVKPHPIKALFPYTVKEIARGGDTADTANLSATKVEVLEGRGTINEPSEVIAALKEKHATPMVWKWRIPYFYCHYNERMKLSGYIRLMEEAEDLFLAENGISIRKMLHDRKWIPVVPSAQVEILQEAMMEETLYTAYTLVDTYRDFTYTHQMDCYVVRDGRLVHTATGTITHGYARINDRTDWSLVAFDDETKASIHRNLADA